MSPFALAEGRGAIKGRPLPALTTLDAHQWFGWRQLGLTSPILRPQEPLQRRRWRLRLSPRCFFFQKMVSVGKEWPNKTAHLVTGYCANVFSEGYTLASAH